MKVLSIISLIFVSTVMVNCTSQPTQEIRGIASSTTWNVCYHEDKSRLYFYDSQNLENWNPDEPSHTFFDYKNTDDGQYVLASPAVKCSETRTVDSTQAPALEDSFSADNTTTKTISIDELKGKKFLISQWMPKGGAAAMTLIVLTPGDAPGTVKTLCKHQSIGDEISGDSFQVNKGVFKLGINQYEDEDPTKGVEKVYKDCFKL